MRRREFIAVLVPRRPDHSGRGRSSQRCQSAAKALGLIIPETLLGTTDEVIQ
jgi:hypothetical protein